MTRVVILGGGPAGAGAAYRLARERRAEVVLVERADRFGGNAASFAWNGHDLDYGSHRLHPSCAPEILADIRSMLGEGLLDRPRHGRIQLLGRWVHFPLRAGDLVRRAPLGFLAGSARDAALKPFRGGGGPDDHFAAVLERALGPTICRDFYFPYARKIWGREPSLLAGVQARRRVSASTPAKLLRKILSQVPGFRAPGAGRFFYPRGGFGRITDAYADAARAHGAALLAGHAVERLEAPARPGGRWKVVARHAGGTAEFDADHVWSTLPVTMLARLIVPAVPADVIDAASRVAYRSMVLAYLELDVPQFSEYDAHYFPGADIRMTRMSEPSNYGLVRHPEGRTVLCAEFPCDRDDDLWRATDAELAAEVAHDLETSGVPLPRAPRAVHTVRLPHAYPLYTTGYEKALGVVSGHLADVPGLLSYGRQGLFAHDNTHHALAMAYAATGCLSGGGFDRAKWATHLAEFATHVVED